MYLLVKGVLGRKGLLREKCVSESLRQPGRREGEREREGERQKERQIKRYERERERERYEIFIVPMMC